MAVTGGTGFVGQCVVEKLLRCCPEIKKILILLRKKQNMNAHERISQLVKLPVSFYAIKFFVLLCIFYWLHLLEI